MKFFKKHKMLSIFIATLIALSSANFVMIYDLVTVGVKLATLEKFD